MRLWPKSLVGQAILASGAALLLAHLLAAVLLYRAGEQQREERQVNAAAFLLIEASGEGEFSDLRRPRRGRGRLPPGIRATSTADDPRLPDDVRVAEAETRLSEILAAQAGLQGDILFLRRDALDDPLIAQFLEAARPGIRERLERRQLSVAALKRSGSDQWIVARVPDPRGQRGLPQAMVMQLGIVFLVLAAGQYFLLRRITRPLAALTNRVETFSATQSAEAQISPKGPNDVSRLIEAHNAMERRIVGLLDEKDVMLGAIGHDLKTPLAALRVRVEAVDDESVRSKMAAQIDEITRTLDDILSLARIGRHEMGTESVEIGALLQLIANEYGDLGEPVTLETTSRIVLATQTTWLARAIRNLVDNALRYGGSARLSAGSDGATATIRIEDDGPGIPEGRIEDMLEPFARGETSRNRATGGAGLGLTLARAIAEQQGGELVLANRAEGGLRAELRLPLRD